MSLEKAITHGKEKRKPYYGTKSISKQCRCHGGCLHCEGGRMHKHKRKKISIEFKIKEELGL